MLILFMNSRGLVYYKYVPQHPTITKYYYLKLSRCLHNDMRSNRLDLWKAKTFQLHHHIAPPYSWHLIKNNSWSNTTVLSLIRLPALPRWFFVIVGYSASYKCYWKRSDLCYSTIPQDVFEKCFQQRQDRWEKSVN